MDAWNGLSGAVGPPLWDYVCTFDDSQLADVPAVVFEDQPKAFERMPQKYKALLTGVLRISKENIFSGLNNLEVVTILDDIYADKFGFREDEVKWLLKESKSELTIEEMREWYNGYNIGKYQIYNPWSTCNAIKSNKIKSYWTNTSSDDLILDIMGDTPLESTKLLNELVDKTMP